MAYNTSIQIALNHLFQYVDVAIPENCYADLTTLTQGLKRTVAQYRKNLT